EPEGESASDIVLLTSGNRMTGTVIELYRGELSFAIDGAGPVALDWNNIAELTSFQHLDIELASGERLSGTVSPWSASRLSVTDADTGAATDVAMREVVAITPIAPTAAERTSGYADVGFDFLDANDELDLKLNAEIENRTLNYLTTVSVS